MDIASNQWLIDAALTEDIGRGDITSLALLDVGSKATLRMVAREPMVVCGLELAANCFYRVDSELECSTVLRDGMQVGAGQPLMEISGRVVAILSAERVALNFMARLSAVATLTRRYVEAVQGSNARIVDTRKTLPGYRLLDKYAVRMGGGINHRLRLDDGVLIKDNHIAAVGSITEAINRAREATPLLTRIEVECDTLDQVYEAMCARADMIMLDNMDTTMLREAVNMVEGRMPLEASGGVTLENVQAIAATGVDYISSGALTHSAINVDIGLDWSADNA